jgi:hypothetical protein
MHSQSLVTILLFVLVWTAPLASKPEQRNSGGPRPEEVIAEALHHAIALEKLPDVRNLLARDTIDVEGYIKSNDGYQSMVSSFLPGHVDRWTLRLWGHDSLRTLGEGSAKYHLVIRLKIESGTFRIELVCQPHFEVIDRGKLELEFECLDGVFHLKKLTRSYS